MATTKKNDELDYTKQDLAKTMEEASAQDEKTLLWQSLQPAYSYQAESIQNEYNKALSQQDRTLLSHGMQRSSYGMNTLANLLEQRNKALANNNKDMIAAFQSQLFNMQEAQKNREHEDALQAAQRDWQAGQNALDRAQQTSEREASQIYSSNESRLQREYEAGQNALKLAQDQAQFEISQAFNEKQLEAQMEQYREGLKSDEQKELFDYIKTAMAHGYDVSDELLAKVGLTRADYNLMASSSGGSSYYNPNKGKGGGEEEEPQDSVFESAFADILNSNAKTPKPFLVDDGLDVGIGGRVDTVTDYLKGKNPVSQADIAAAEARLKQLEEEDKKNNKK